MASGTKEKGKKKAESAEDAPAKEKIERKPPDGNAEHVIAAWDGTTSPAPIVSRIGKTHKNRIEVDTSAFFAAPLSIVRSYAIGPLLSLALDAAQKGADAQEVFNAACATHRLVPGITNRPKSTPVARVEKQLSALTPEQRAELRRKLDELEGAAE